MIKYYEDLKLTSQVIQKNNDYKDNVVNSKALSIIEIVGGSDKGSTYTGIQTTFNNYETQDEVMAIIKTTLSKSENQLALLNLIRMRRLNAEIHIDHLKKAKNQTEVLLNQLESLNK